MILAGEFDSPQVDAAQLPHDPVEAGRWIRKAAYLNHAGAQHKMGQAYEYAQLGEAFDPCVAAQHTLLGTAV
jgi:TPR repeat protein